MATLIKIDRNGSKHYEGFTTCTRCGGTGYYAIGVHNGVPVLSPFDGGVCWECHGAGKVIGKWIERTPEYQAKLDAKAAERARARQAEREAKAEEARQAWKAENGFTPDGVTYLFLGDTYSQKEAIKEAGGKYNRLIGWHIDHEVDGFLFLAVNLDDIAQPLINGYELTTSVKEMNDAKDAEYKRLTGRKDSEWIGKVKQRLNLHVTYLRVNAFDGYMGRTTYVHTFEDADGNVLVWKTGNVLEYIDENGTYQYVAEGSDFDIAATVKDHTEYRGVKQTEVTRLKIK